MRGLNATLKPPNQASRPWHELAFVWRAENITPHSRMRAVTAAEIIQIWEIGQRQSALDRALTTLSIACPHKTLSEWAATEIGERDAQLFMVREQAFGPELEALVDCPKCENPLELTLSTSALCPPRNTEDGSGPLMLVADGYELSFRLPNSFDIAEAIRVASAEECPENTLEKETRIERTVFQRCVESARYHGMPVAFEDLPTAILGSLDERLSEADPRMEIQVDLRCPACCHQWSLLFDIASFLWAEIGHRARRLLSEVHVMASAYGWHETEILTLSAQRRQFYLECIRA
jgi:hypothetical protein